MKFRTLAPIAAIAMLATSPVLAASNDAKPAMAKTVKAKHVTHAKAVKAVKK